MQRRTLLATLGSLTASTTGCLGSAAAPTADSDRVTAGASGTDGERSLAGVDCPPFPSAPVRTVCWPIGDRFGIESTSTAPHGCSRLISTGRRSKRTISSFTTSIRTGRPESTRRGGVSTAEPGTG